MIEIICNVPGGRYRGGIKHTAGRKLYKDKTFTPAQIKEFAFDPGFEINLGVVEGLLEEAAEPEEFGLEDAIAYAAGILTPVAVDYGVEPADIASALTKVFADAQEDAEKEDLNAPPFDELIEATRELIAETPRDENKFAGDRPKTKALASVVGWRRVTGPQRDRAFALASKE